MQIDGLSNSLGTVNFDGLDKAKENVDPVALPWEMLMLWASPSESMPEILERNSLRHALVVSSSEIRNKVVTELKQFSGTVSGSDIGKQIDQQLDEIEKKSDEQGPSVDRLLELLFSLLQLMAKANTERSRNAAKMGEIAVHQAKVSGDNNVGAANSNLAGSITALAVGVGVAGVGFSQYSKGAKGHSGNLDGNNKKLQVKTVEKNREEVVAKQQARPVNTDTPQEKLDKVAAKKSELDAEDGSRAQLVQPEMKVSDGVTEKSGPTKDFNQGVSGDNSVDFGRGQFAGQAISGFSPFVSNVAQSGFGIYSASKSAEAKVNDAEHDIASNLQHNEDQLTQRLSDLMVKLLSLITSAAEEANRNIAERSQAIKA